MPPSSSSPAQLSVSNLHNRKRRNTNDPTQDNPSVKRIKLTSALPKALPRASNFPPEFWDNLSKVWLTPRALRERDRRNVARPPYLPSATQIDVTPTTLARFARRGGPDLHHLRGYPEPKHATRMSSNRPSASSSRRTQSTKATSVTSKAKRSSAYDKDFEQNLIDHNIYPKGHKYPDDDLIPEPNNLDDIVQALSAPRASLSPSKFNQSAFKAFTLANDRVISEGNVMVKILPTILGDADIPSEGNLPFTNVDSITDGTTVDAVPDLYDGSYPKDITKTVRQDLNKMITPTTHGRAPLVPNFFVEAKAPRGGADVAKRQACLDGAIGARAMHCLQTYSEDEQIYDENANTFSSTYHAGTGTLQLYAHHITAPTDEGERPEYHMTQIDGWQMTGNIGTFRSGATAFRNARDLARCQRETLIKAANARAMQAQEVAAGKQTCQVHQDKNPYEPIDHAEATSWQEFHDDLQHHIAKTCADDHDVNGEAPTTPEHNYASDDSQDVGDNPAASGIDNPSMSFMSSFTSTFSTDTTRPKRSRQSFSSPTQGSRLSKSRSRPTAMHQSAGSPNMTAEL